MSQIAVPVETADFLRLAAFLRKAGSSRDPVSAVGDAISYYLDNLEWKSDDLLPETALGQTKRGYSWKELFLPAGTSLRMRYADSLHYAEVDGDDVKYLGQKMSPSEFANKVAGSERNAWRDLWVLRPDDAEWIRAENLRSHVPTRNRAKLDRTMRQETPTSISSILTKIMELHEKGLCKNWRDCLIRALLEEGGSAHRMKIITRLRDLRKEIGASVPETLEQTAQGSFEASCRQSENFSGNPDHDLFEWPEGKGAGTWALKIENVSRHIDRLHQALDQ